MVSEDRQEPSLYPSGAGNCTMSSAQSQARVLLSEAGGPVFVLQGPLQVPSPEPRCLRLTCTASPCAMGPGRRKREPGQVAKARVLHREQLTDEAARGGHCEPLCS